MTANHRLATLRAAALTSLFLGVSYPATAQDPGQRNPQIAIQIQRLSGPILFDGEVTEPAWDEVSPFPLIQYEPIYHAELTQRTELRVAHDENYLYFSCRCYESDPSLIQITSLKRDNFNSGFDQVILLLDTFNDNENSLLFTISAAGVRTDATITQDGTSYSSSWNTFWDARTSFSNEGWFAEGRIPLTSLKFNTEDGKTTMGLSIIRYIARTRETHIFPDIPPNWGQYSWLKSSRAQKVEFKDISSRKPLYVTPYAIGGLGQRFELNDSESRYERVDDPTVDVGLDLKYGLTNNLTLDVTVNTDFAQVEADDQQVNLTRFSLFFPEKRLFFLERASNFEFNFGGSDRLFYSRRIGITDGRQVPMIGGVRVVGRVGAWDLGALTMQSARSGDLLSENFGVFRLRRQVVNPSSYVGAVLTSRVDEDGMYNLAYGTDGIFRIREDDYLTVQWAQTFRDKVTASFESARFRARWYKNRNEGLLYEFGASRSGRDYEPGIGFQRRKDFSSVNIKVGYGWVPSAKSSLRQHEFSLKSEWFVQNDGGQTDTWELGGRWEGLWRSGTQAIISFSRKFESLTDSFSLSDEITIPTGKYTNVFSELSYTQPSQQLLRASIKATVGSFFEGFQTSISVNPTWNASRFLELGGSYRYDRIYFPDDDKIFSSHLTRLRAQLTLTATLSITSFIQASTEEDLAIANFRLRFNPREGNDFYLVYNEGLNIDRLASEPRLPLSDGRTILMKYTYTFLW
ncbi:MAG: hypothetical protein BMS9Abin05_1625 [Rhodothermia bacterium]|nr:MAG: hypothetical protein BMS9Abin05_1625 [Rhodothermia bacterium]